MDDLKNINVLKGLVMRESKNSIKRRQFIKESAMSLAGFYIIPRHVLGGKGFRAPSDRLYIAAVGCGNEAYSDISVLSRMPDNKAVISHLCDVDLRQSIKARKDFPKAKFFKDWREMFEKEKANFDAVTVAIPDHNHAIVGLNAMKLHKHLYLQKPLTHDIYEARVLTEAARKYKVVTQMGNQLASADGVRTLKEWFDAELIGDISKVYNWTNRPVWPQGIPWPTQRSPIPKELDWDLWLGTAQQINYVAGLVPGKWRGWWDYGTGALGDMGCHIMGPTFKLLGIGYPTKITCEVARVFSGWGEEADYTESIPPASKIRFTFQKPNGRDLQFFWYDGGLLPPRPEGIDPNINMNDLLFSGYFGATIFVGERGIIACGEGGLDPRLLPISLTDDVRVPQKYPRVKGGADGHYWQWVEAAIAGYHNDYEGNSALPVLGEEKAYVDSPIEEYGGPLTETVLMGNLVMRSFGLKKKTDKGIEFPGRYIEYEWDGANMKFSNFPEANQFVKREYREGWGPLEI